MRASALTVVATVTAGLALAGCSSTGAPTGAAAEPACDADAVTPVVTAYLADDKDTELRQISGLECQDGWAVIFPTIGPADGSEPGTIDITLVAKAVDGAWVIQDRDETVCGAPQTGDNPSPPADAAVPAELWRAACQTN